MNIPFFFFFPNPSHHHHLTVHVFPWCRPFSPLGLGMWNDDWRVAPTTIALTVISLITLITLFTPNANGIELLCNGGGGAAAAAAAGADAIRRDDLVGLRFDRRMLASYKSWRAGWRQ